MKIHKVLHKMGVYSGILGSMLFLMFPIIWMLFTSLKEHRQAIAVPPVWLFTPSLDAYRIAVLLSPLGREIINSFIIAGSATVLSIVLGSLAAYACVRIRIRGSEIISYMILSIRFFPAISLVFPYYLIMQSWGLYDTHIALILVYTAFNLPFATWMIMSFFQELPREVEESAMLDGCSQLKTLFRITIPIARGGIAATAILCFMLAWNEFLYAVVLTSQKAVTAQVGVAAYIENPATGTNWELISAGAIILIAPLMLFGIVVQRHLVRGLTFGAVS